MLRWNDILYIVHDLAYDIASMFEYSLVTPVRSHCAVLNTH